jgi:GNAT superfamily N-acetyltransferase
MGIRERALVRFGGIDDFEWCVVEDFIVPEQVIRNKIINNEIIIAEADGNPIGYIRLEFILTNIPYIGLIFVLKDYQKEGIGSKMLNFLEDHLKKLGHDFLLSSSDADQADAQAWYRGIGFVECGIMTGINEGGIGEIFFRKNLR